MKNNKTNTNKRSVAAGVLAGLILLSAGVGCRGLADIWWGHGGQPPQPPVTEPPQPPSTQPTSPPHPCQDCLDRGYQLCNHGPYWLVTGCCNQPPGETCTLIPPKTGAPGTHCGAIEEWGEVFCNCWNYQRDECWHYLRCPSPSGLPGVEPVCQPTPTPTPAPPTPTPTPEPIMSGDCEYPFDTTPIRVDRNLPMVPLIGHPGRRMFKSACLSIDPIAPGVGGNGACFADNFASGTNPELIARLKKHDCFWGHGVGRFLGPESEGGRSPGYDECYLYEPGHRIIDAPNTIVNADGFFVDVNFDPSTGDVAIDAAGRPVSYRGGTPHLLAWRGFDGEIIAGGDAAHGWGRNSLVPPLVDRTCIEPAPTPTPTPVPSPSEPIPIIHGMGITIAIRCAGGTPNCGVHEVTGPEVDTGRVFRAPLRGVQQNYVIDASYFLNRRSQKIDFGNPLFPGPLVSWKEDVLMGDKVDCTNFWDHPQGMTLTAMGISAPKPEDEDQGYANGTRNRWTACNEQGLCGSVILEVLP